MADKIDKEEKARLAKQVKDLGPEGIIEKAKLLERAKAEHDRPIPTKLLTDFPVPDVKSISWIPVHSVQERGSGRAPVALGTTPAEELRKHIEADGPELPFFVQFDDVKVRTHATSGAMRLLLTLGMSNSPIS